MPYSDYSYGSCRLTAGPSDAVVAVFFFAGLVATIGVVGRNLPRRLSERVGRAPPRAWR